MGIGSRRHLMRALLIPVIPLVALALPRSGAAASARPNGCALGPHGHCAGANPAGGT